MTKIIVVSSCGECPYFVANDSYLDGDFWSKYMASRYCTKLDRSLKDITKRGIPDWCPLEEVHE